MFAAHLDDETGGMSPGGFGGRSPGVGGAARGVNFLGMQGNRAAIPVANARRCCARRSCPPRGKGATLATTGTAGASVTCWSFAWWSRALAPTALLALDDWQPG